MTQWTAQSLHDEMQYPALYSSIFINILCRFNWRQNRIWVLIARNHFRMAWRMTCRGHIKRLLQRPCLRGGGDSVSVRGVCEFGVLTTSDKSDRFYESDVFIKAFEAALKAFRLDGSQESLRSSTCGLQRNQIGGRCLMLANKKTYSRCDHVGYIDIFRTSWSFAIFHNTLLVKADLVNSVHWTICFHRQKGWCLLKGEWHVDCTKFWWYQWDVMTSCLSKFTTQPVQSLTRFHLPDSDDNQWRTKVIICSTSRKYKTPLQKID